MLEQLELTPFEQEQLILQERKSHRYREISKDRITPGFALLPFLLGLVVLFGWYTNNVTLIQVLPSFVPMQFNTALGFLIIGLGLGLLTLDKTGPSIAMGGLAILIGGLTLVEYIFGSDLGIDQLFMEHYVTVETSHPGRMAPNTALCFFLSGLLLIWGNIKQNEDKSLPYWMVFTTLGSLILGLGSTALGGYLTDIQGAYGWAKLTKMAVHTSIGFIIFGLGSLFYAWGKRPDRFFIPDWFYIPVGVGVMTTTILMWEASQIPNSLETQNNYILVLGTAFSALMTLLVKQEQNVRRKSEAQTLANRQLEDEVLKRSEAELELVKHRDQLEEMVEAATAEVNTILQVTSSGVFTLDGYLKIKSFNSAATEIFGWEKEDIIGKKIQTIMPEDEENEYSNYIHEFIKSDLEKQSLDEERVGLTKTGDDVPLFLSLGIIKLSGEKILFVGMVQDITKLKKAEQELKDAKETAEEASKAKADFLATMSHEIRTPMNGVIGMVDLLHDTKLNKDQKQMVRTIRQSGYALLTVINDILDFSKIEAGKLEFEKIPVSVRDIVEGVGETLAPIAYDKGVTISTLVDPHIPDAVLSDQVRLRQILFNLAGNAVKFTEKGKALIKATLVDEGKESVKVQFDVIDSGIGISKKALDKLFTAFTQAEGSTTRRFGGTGLGLTICKRLVDLMKGNLEVESEEGVGSTFTVTMDFPIAKDHRIQSEKQNIEGLKVLLVLLDPDMIGGIKEYLKYWGAETMSVHEMDEVMHETYAARAGGKPFDVIIYGSGWGLDLTALQIDELQKKHKDGPVDRFVVMTQKRGESHQIPLENTIYVGADPLRRASFLHAVAIAAGRASPDIDFEEEDIIEETSKPLASIEDSEKEGRLILLAEDNKTNQLVIRKQLNRLGYNCLVADDGQEALSILKKHHFGLLLTDCHMPNMDGHELTQTLRAEEKKTGDKLPIIAVTASILSAEVDKCYTSGMDDFLSKPVDIRDLKIKLHKFLGKDNNVDLVKTEEDKETIENQDQNNAKASSEAIQFSALKELVGDDDEVINEILEDFVGATEETLEELKSGFESGDADAVGKTAHKLKSSTKTIGANDLAALCLELEMAGKAGNMDKINELYPKVTPLSENVFAEIEARLKG